MSKKESPPNNPQYRYKCTHCDTVVTTRNRDYPDPNMDGPCPGGFSHGEHYWIRSHGNG